MHPALDGWAPRTDKGIVWMLIIFCKNWFMFQLHTHFILLSLLITLKSHGTLWKSTVLALTHNYSNISYTSCSFNWNHWLLQTAPGPSSVLRLTVGCYVAAVFSGQFRWGLLERCNSNKVLDAGQRRYISGDLF